MANADSSVCSVGAWQGYDLSASIFKKFESLKTIAYEGRPAIEITLRPTKGVFANTKVPYRVTLFKDAPFPVMWTLLDDHQRGIVYKVTGIGVVPPGNDGAGLKYPLTAKYVIYSTATE